MFKFKDTFVAFLALASFGGLGVIAGAAALSNSYPISMLAFVIWFLLCVFLFERFARKRLAKLTGLLNDCHVEEYVEAYDKIEERAHGSDGKRRVIMNKARGLINLGAIDEALDILEDVSISEKHKPREMHLLSLYQMILFDAFIEKGDMEKAVKALSVCKYMVNDSLYREPYRSNMMELCRRADARLALARGEFEDLEEEYWETMRKSPVLLDKVISHYRLAEIAEHFGETEERKEHLEFVVNNGGSTIYKFLAQLALDGATVQDRAINYGFVDEDDD